MAGTLEDFIKKIEGQIKAESKELGQMISPQEKKYIAGRIKDSIEREMKDIRAKTADMYYDGYTPKSYDRTYQLYKAFEPVVTYEVSDKNAEITMRWKFNADNPEERMHHSRVYINRHGGRSGDRGRADEQKIIDNFRHGIHPNAKEKYPIVMIEDETDRMLAEVSTKSHITDIANKFVKVRKVTVTKSR